MSPKRKPLDVHAKCPRIAVLLDLELETPIRVMCRKSAGHALPEHFDPSADRRWVDEDEIERISRY